MTTGRTTGMTLIEVLVVVAILGFGLVPLIGLFTGQSRQASQSIYLLNAHGHALQRLRRTESELHTSRFPAELVDSVRHTRFTTSWGHRDGTPDVVDETVVCRPSDVTDGLVVVDVTVAWTESRGDGVRDCSHHLMHGTCIPTVGQEALPWAAEPTP